MMDFKKFDLTKDVPITYANSTIGPAAQPEGEAAPDSVDTPALRMLLGEYFLGDEDTEALDNEDRIISHINTWHQAKLAEAVHDARLDAIRGNNTLMQERAEKAEAERDDMAKRKDSAYLERNQVVAALAKCFPSGIARTAIAGWSEDWHGCIYIDLPTGQASWHFHDSQAYLFEGLPGYGKGWDGHGTEEKYARIAKLTAQPAPQANAGPSQGDYPIDRKIAAAPLPVYQPAPQAGDALGSIDASAKFRSDLVEYFITEDGNAKAVRQFLIDTINASRREAYDKGRADGVVAIAQKPIGHLLTLSNGVMSYFSHPAPSYLEKLGTVQKLYAAPPASAAQQEGR